MYSRIIKPPESKSFFLFGPRGTGKSHWVRTTFPKALYLDLLESEIFTQLLANPQRLDDLIEKNFSDWIILDEVQKIPALLDEVHRQIERKKRRFILTGSSARKLRQRGVNLLAGRARTHRLYPLVAPELGKDFRLLHSLKYGQLPSVYQDSDPQAYLRSYVATYLREEIQQEGLTRNLGAFTRFLETASYSQGAVLNVSNVARDCSVERKVVENYFAILEDLLLSFRLPIFTKRAKRKLIAHDKFYFFDVGIYRILRPKGPLDSSEELDGTSLETLCLQELRALNDYLGWEYGIYYWRTTTGLEVDFVLYGERGLKAIEIKRASEIRGSDLEGLKAFLEDYPKAEAFLFYSGTRERREGGIRILPLQDYFQEFSTLF